MTSGRVDTSRDVDVKVKVEEEAGQKQRTGATTNSTWYVCMYVCNGVMRLDTAPGELEVTNDGVRDRIDRARL